MLSPKDRYMGSFSSITVCYIQYFRIQNIRIEIVKKKMLINSKKKITEKI